MRFNCEVEEKIQKPYYNTSRLGLDFIEQLQILMYVVLLTSLYENARYSMN